MIRPAFEWAFIAAGAVWLAYLILERDWAQVSFFLAVGLLSFAIRRCMR